MTYMVLTSFKDDLLSSLLWNLVLGDRDIIHTISSNLPYLNSHSIVFDSVDRLQQN